jgi:hypothetical protein
MPSIGQKLEMFSRCLINKTPGHGITGCACPKTAATNSVCPKRYTTFQATDLPLSQREPYGSDECFKSSARRNRIEGLFDNLKNEATENVKRGIIRVRGLIKMGNLVSFGVASANRRLQESFKKHSITPVKPILGLPKKKSVAPFAQVFASDANSNTVSQARNLTSISSSLMVSGFYCHA